MKKSYDGIIGLALADAMGVPVEFESREDLKKDPVTDVQGYGTYLMPEGCWSDDTSLTIAAMDAIIKNAGTINENTYTNIADNFSAYYFNNAFTPTDIIFDIGGTTRTAILKYTRKVAPAPLCGGTLPSNAGNGALMRILPIAYYAHANNLNDQETFEIVKNVAGITHRLETCSLGSYIYVQYAKELLNGSSKEDAYSKMQQADYSFFSKDALEDYKRVLKDDISKFPEDSISSVGKTRPTLEATLWSFLNNNNYNDAILTAINLGDDTDTVGACTGGLAGLYYGADSIEKKWLEKIKKPEYLKALCSCYDMAIYTKTVPKEFSKIEEQGKPKLKSKFSSIDDLFR